MSNAMVVVLCTKNLKFVAFCTLFSKNFQSLSFCFLRFNEDLPISRRECLEMHSTGQYTYWQQQTKDGPKTDPKKVTVKKDGESHHTFFSVGSVDGTGYCDVATFSRNNVSYYGYEETFVSILPATMVKTSIQHFVISSAWTWET